MSEWTVGRRYRVPGAAVTEHWFQVPLDYADAPAGSIRLFALELAGLARADDQLPWLVFLQGGPGSPAPRPLRGDEGWFGRALRDYRVLLLDQRGTGLSTPLTWRQAQRFGSAKDLARYIGLLRADSIVADAEFIRARLSGDRPWETLGQSYGGRVTMTYLSRAPQGLRACYIAGGLPSLTATAYEVSQRTVNRVRQRVQAFYRRYPEDAEAVQRIRDRFRERPVQLLSGQELSLDRFRQLGRLLGMSDGFAKLHWLLGGAVGTDGELSDTLLAGISEVADYAGNPLHAVLLDHNKIERGQPTRWPGARAVAEQPDFDDRADPLLLSGEFVYPWMFEQIPALRPFRDAVHILNEDTAWPDLWDVDVLSRNTVPVAAAIYHEDMYVDASDSLATSAAVPHVSHWITNEWQHDGLRRSGGAVLDRLITMARSDWPSQ